MTGGAARLLEEHGGPLNVAKALLEGRLNSFDQTFAGEAIGSEILLRAAQMQISDAVPKKMQRLLHLREVLTTACRLARVELHYIVHVRERRGGLYERALEAVNVAIAESEKPLD